MGYDKYGNTQNNRTKYEHTNKGKTSDKKQKTKINCVACWNHRRMCALHTKPTQQQHWLFNTSVYSYPANFSHDGIHDGGRNSI